MERNPAKCGFYVRRKAYSTQLNTTQISVTPSHEQLQGTTMRVLTAAFSLALLAGCANPSMQEMRASGPAKVYVSEKKEDVLSNCILFAWQETSLASNGMPMATQPGRNGGATVYAGNREYFADVTSTSSGSKAAYYELGDSWGSKILKPEVQSCL